MNESTQLEMRSCAYCRGMFQPARERQEFCSNKHRSAYHKDVGTEGTVAGVTRLKRGVSVVIHFSSGPAAERAVNLMKGETVRAVLKP